ncbi:hypothetical protein Tcan_08522 [Toxocara canis]|uniref:Uncharacterized protein n=1 Tax=Toxocara canis TaxID=6265 RepID=A0A0B2VIS4_TOXCA|nr:hypothetical protein Tcan_08522 [Toxocara canis]
MGNLLVATIRDVVGSLVPDVVRMLTHFLHSILNSNSGLLQAMERDTSNALQSLKDTVATHQHTSRSAQQAENSSTFTFGAGEQQWRRSAVFIGVAESCDPPHLRHECDVELMAEILDELNVDGVPVEVYRIRVFNLAKRCPVKDPYLVLC